MAIDTEKLPYLLRYAGATLKNGIGELLFAAAEEITALRAHNSDSSEPVATSEPLTARQLEAVCDALDRVLAGDADGQEIPMAVYDRAYSKIVAMGRRLSALASPPAKEVEITEEMVERGLAQYSEGGCMGLDQRERREVVEAIITAALK